MTTVTEQQQAAEMNNILTDVMWECARLASRIRKFSEIGNPLHPAADPIEAHLIAAARVACGIDSHLFDNAAWGCISGRLH